MFSLVLRSILILITVMSVAMAAYANEGGGHGGGEEKKAEGGEKKEGEGGAEEKPVKSAEESYDKVAAKVAALEAKVHSGQEEIEKLIEEKAHTKDPARINEIVKQMLTLHKELKKNVEEYDQVRGLMKYRYPEKGLATKREYERIEVKSLDDMESQMSLSSSVKRTMKKVRTQYDTPDQAKARKEAEVAGHAEGSKKKKKEPELTEPVILKK
ncbi:hypothetical protein B9G69_007040 [Bdellovibrio sp. SKB1291214]|uniref:hypothetical protein n=1 Tax=Bdellovibrio sp. SKB1291214 TaxID=1732569 RepID=UPI000B51B03C|nr:hypothetical protein [Bdellovibrio sp. SKB1291214]UYL10334.1 hypothetical protein B9G69_007040 [Bdellovibrio sp. SKB1291214]